MHDFVMIPSYSIASLIEVLVCGYLQTFLNSLRTFGIVSFVILNKFIPS